MIPENADQAPQSLCSTHKKKQGSGNERAIKERNQALRLGLCEESYLPKLTDSQKFFFVSSAFAGSSPSVT